MESCIHFKVIDESVGNDAFDHPTYSYYCRKKDKTIRSEQMCSFCECYRASTLYGNLEKLIFVDGKMILDSEIDSINFHAMTHEDTEILGQFCDFTGITGDTLREVLLLGYLTRMERINKYKTSD